MTLSTYFQELILIFLEILCFYFISCSAFEIKAIQKLKLFTSFIFLLPFINILVLLESKNVLSFLIIVAFCFFGIFYIFKESFFNTFLVFISEYIVLIFIQLITIPLVHFLSLHLESYWVQIAGDLFSVFIMFFVYKFLDLSFFIKFLNHADMLPKAIIANSFVLTFGFVYYSKISSDRFFHYFILIFIILLLVLFVNGDLILTNFKMLKQKKQLDAYQEYLPIVEQLIDHVRQTQHAHNNNIQAIRMLPATCNSYDELSKELLHYTNYLVVQNEPMALLKINLKLVAGFLYSKILYAQSIKKSLRVQIQNFEFQLKTPEYEMITMIGILVDNALEASNETENVYSILKSENNFLVFEIKNIGPEITPVFISSIFQKGYTTKISDLKSHGIGLFQLKKMADSYDGTITVYNESIEEKNYLCFELKIQ